MTGGPFVGVRGTFNVPNLAAAPGVASASEWVGIDGNDNQFVIQAGVQQDFDPSTGRVTHYAWWEILPDQPTQIGIPLMVQPGDLITVVIARTADPRRAARPWWIFIANDTTGKTFRTHQRYAGPGDSVEWVVEAPATNHVQDVLGAYSPEVKFTHLGLRGASAGITREAIRQAGRVVSTPSPLDGGSFAVAYGAVAPGASQDS
jgi:hypothetical protein